MDQLAGFMESLVKRQEDIVEGLRTLRKTNDKSQKIMNLLVASNKLVGF